LTRILLEVIVVTNWAAFVWAAKKKIKFSTVFAGQAVGIKEVHDR